MSERNQPRGIEIVAIKPHRNDLLTHFWRITLATTATGMACSLSTSPQGWPIWSWVGAVACRVVGCRGEDGGSEMRGCEPSALGLVELHVGTIQVKITGYFQGPTGYFHTAI
jgi:hypothetical protein